MSRVKHLKKLAKILAEADNCLTRKRAQKLLKKALKIDKKLNNHDDN